MGGAPPDHPGRARCFAKLMAQVTPCCQALGRPCCVKIFWGAKVKEAKEIENGAKAIAGPSSWLAQSVARRLFAWVGVEALVARQRVFHSPSMSSGDDPGKGQ